MASSVPTAAPPPRDEDEYSKHIAADVDSDADDLDDSHAAGLLASLRPLSGVVKPPRPVSGKVATFARRASSPDATSDVALGQPSRSTVAGPNHAPAPPRRDFPGSRPTSARNPAGTAPAPPSRHPQSSRPVSARHPGGGTSTSMSGYGVMLAASAAPSDTPRLQSGAASRPSRQGESGAAKAATGTKTATTATRAGTALSTFTGAREVAPSPTHRPTRPGSLAFRPSLSHHTQHVVDEAQRCRFDTTVHMESNHDALVHAHRNMSLRDPDPAGQDPRAASSVAGRQQAKVDAARQRRMDLELRLRANVPNFTVPGSRFAASDDAVAQDEVADRVRSLRISRRSEGALGDVSLTSDLPDPVAECSAQQQYGDLQAKLSKLRRELAFRTAYRIPRNDDLRLDNVVTSSLGHFNAPYVAPDKVFSCRTSKDAVDAAFADADAAADAAKSPRDSRPLTPRSVAGFFNRGGRSGGSSGGAGDVATSAAPYDAPTFEEQDERYAATMHAAVRAAVARGNTKSASNKKAAGPPKAAAQPQRSVTASSRPRPNTAAARAGRFERQPSPRQPAAITSARVVPTPTAAAPTTVHDWVEQVAVARAASTTRRA